MVVCLAVREPITLKEILSANFKLTVRTYKVLRVPNLAQGGDHLYSGKAGKIKSKLSQDERKCNNW